MQEIIILQVKKITCMYLIVGYNIYTFLLNMIEIQI